MQPYLTRPGSRFPPGAIALPDGVNFCVFSRHATHVELLLYQNDTSSEPFQVITLIPEKNRTLLLLARAGGSVAAAYLLHLASGRTARHDADGAVFQRAQGTARSVGARGERCPMGPAQSRQIRRTPATLAARSGDQASASVTRTRTPARAGGRGHYELHVGGFTRDPSSGVKHPGTFAGLVEKIPYLKALGVTHVELMPVMAFDEQDVPASARPAGCATTGATAPTVFTPRTRAIAWNLRRPLQEFRALTDAFTKQASACCSSGVQSYRPKVAPRGPVINFKGLRMRPAIISMLTIGAATATTRGAATR